MRSAAASPPEERGPILREAAELLSKVGNHRLLASGYINAAYAAIKENRLADATDLLDIAMPAAETSGSAYILMLVCGNVGLARLFSDDLPGAREAFARQLELCAGNAFIYGADEGLVGLAAIAAAENRPEHSAMLLGAARAMGYFLTPGNQPVVDRLEDEFFAPARARVSPAAWQRSEEAGGRLSYEDAIAAALRGGSQLRLREQGLEQLDRVARRVLEQDLFAPDAGDDLVAEPGAVLTQPCDGRLDVVDLELKAIPPSGLRHGPVGHCLAAARAAAGRAQHQSQITVGEHREGRCRVHLFGEPELSAVELDRGVDIVDDVAHAHLGHVVSSR
jgi:hypothetical protein